MPDSQSQTADLIRRYYDAFNQGNREAFLALLNPDVVHDINQGGTENGVDAFREFLRRMDSSYRERVEDLVVFSSEDGTRAAAEFYIRGAYFATDAGLPPATGQTYHLRVGAFFDICEGKVSRITNYYNLQDWLTQVAGTKGEGS